jgi:predicted transcriptional regulator
MEAKLTELEKSILLAFLILARGTTKQIKIDSILVKFPLNQRKMAREYVYKLVKNGFLVKYPYENYSLSESGLKRAARLLAEGAMLLK